MTKAEYYAYLQSEAWRLQRARLMQGKPKTCVKCGTGGRNIRLDVHHLNYRNIHDVRPEDVVYLCRICHKHVETAKEDGRLGNPHTLQQLLTVQQPGFIHYPAPPPSKRRKKKRKNFWGW